MSEIQERNPESQPQRKKSYAPSSFERWSRCPGSVHFLPRFPKAPDSPAAFRGKWTHSIAEKELLGKELSDKDLRFLSRFPAFRGALDHYLRYVRELRGRIGGDLWVEKQVPLRYSGGRAFIDALLLSGDERSLHVIDLKTGTFPVRAEDSAQIRIYASELLLFHSPDFSLPEVEEVVLSIIQPRSPGGDSHLRTSRGELSSWREEILLPAFDRVQKATEKDLVPGPAQCRYCDARSSCPAYSQWKRAGTDFLL